MDRKTGLAFLVLVAILAFVGFRYLIPKTKVAPAPTPTPISISDWKTFSNGEYSFKFPANWVLQNGTLYSYSPNEVQVKDTNFWDNKIKIEMGKMGGTKDPKQTLEGWFADYKILEEKTGAGPIDIATQKSIIFTGKKAIVTTMKSDQAESQTYYVEKGTYVYFISALGDLNSTNQAILDRIMSTFEW